MIKSYKDVLVLIAVVGGIILPITGFTLFLTNRGSPVIFESIGVTVFLLLGILFWFGLGLAGILRVLGIALIASGLICIIRRPLPAIACLLIGIVCRLAAFWLTRRIPRSNPEKIP